MFSTLRTKKSAKEAAAAISSAVLEHNVACAREGVQMATRAKDAKSAIAAAEHVVDAVAHIMTSNKIGIKTLQQAAAASPSAEELAEIVYTAKLIAAVTYSAAAEALATEGRAAAAEEAKAAAKAAESSLRRRKGYSRLECRVAAEH